jgi:hypothetical protein
LLLSVVKGEMMGEIAAAKDCQTYKGKNDKPGVATGESHEISNCGSCHDINTTDLAMAEVPLLRCAFGQRKLT